MTAITDTIAAAIRQATDDGANTTEEYAEVIAAAIEPVISRKATLAGVLAAEAFSEGEEARIRADECRKAADDLVERAGPIAHPWAADLRHRAGQHEKGTA